MKEVPRRRASEAVSACNVFSVDVPRYPRATELAFPFACMNARACALRALRTRGPQGKRFESAYRNRIGEPRHGG